ncbi:MAG: DNA mismatch repair endonuclease MutL [Deltaproteobacteria bacterium]|nr:DNA mismatch repair endonuclease MutL [Deltaproteobacteria bacterium]
MGRIRILPEALTNRIAAGEVVERPASVVKELLENALDAKASRVSVEVEGGGRSLIRVIDDGCGMEPDDALLALDRYATSKIADDDDLFSISTLGFRGEALPSIASVCRLTLVTRTPDADAATRVTVHGGTIKDVSTEGAPPGTMVEACDLFYNTPARRKFLKTIPTEMAHMADILCALAMGWPRVGFSLSHNGRTQLEWLPCATPAQRVAEVLGKDAGGALIPVEHEEEVVSLTGFLAPPHINRTTGRNLFVFVNNRLVRDRVVHHAVMTGYEGRLMKGRKPVAALFVTVPPDAVDVNVHPAKAEVRFTRAARVHDAVAAAVRRAVSGAAPVQTPGWEPPARPKAPPPAGEQGEPPASAARANAPSAHASLSRTRQAHGVEEALVHALSPAAEPSAGPAGRAALFSEQADQGDPSLSVVGQVAHSYIVCETNGGLVLVDQHAAHERVLYEAFSRGGKPQSQTLLIPETVELSHAEANALESLLPGLADAGLSMDRFSGRTFAIKAVPAVLSHADAASLARELAEAAAETGVSTPQALSRALSAAWARMACKAAVKAGQPLNPPAMQKLLADLLACNHPAQCPHGRPVWLYWDKGWIERAFSRK